MSIKTAWLESEGLGKRWAVFVKERFPLVEHFVSIFFLSAANSVVACALADKELQWQLFIISFLVSFSFFFRLRCFDEIKDLSTDKEINPNRPLARGLLRVDQVQYMIGFLTVLELALVSIAGIEALMTFSVVAAYSYLMYKEFFIGKLLSRYLTTYAVAHTVVSMGVAYSIYAINTKISFSDFSPAMLVFAVATWAIFNLFEFARKSFAFEEERTNVPTYTSIFGIYGAVLLSLSQMYIAVGIIFYLYLSTTVFSLNDVFAHIVVAAIPTLAGIGFMVKKNIQWAHWFRTLSAIYLVIYYVLVTYQAI